MIYYKLIVNETDAVLLKDTIDLFVRYVSLEKEMKRLSNIYMYMFKNVIVSKMVLMLNRL